MDKMELENPGARLRHARKNILRMKQDDVAKDLGVVRSLISTMETGQQGISRNTIEKLFNLYGINPSWLLSGVGEPTNHPKGSFAEDENVILKEQKMSYEETVRGAYLFTDPQFVRDQLEPGRFGYLDLNGTRLRFHAARDSAIQGSDLFRIVEDDRLWFVAGSPNGWEFEVLREYFDFGGDRTLELWMECLRVIRWQRRLLLKGIAAAR